MISRVDMLRRMDESRDTATPKRPKIRHDLQAMRRALSSLLSEKWSLSIPPNPHVDPDLILLDAIDEAVESREQIAALTKITIGMADAYALDLEQHGKKDEARSIRAAVAEVKAAQAARAAA